MLKDFTLKNLKEIRFICLDLRNSTLSMSLSIDGNGDNRLNMGCKTRHDDKAIGFDVHSAQFVVSIMEQVTGHSFEASQGYPGDRHIYVRKN